MTDFEILRLSVRAILEQPHKFEWSLQGFGMLRMYLAPEVRLHVWDSRYANEGVSEMHTHPWDFESLIVVGEVTNVRYDECVGGWKAEEHMRQTIRCGVGGGLEGDPEPVLLYSQTPESYSTGQRYTQAAHEIHVSKPKDGTVTIIERQFKEDTEHAYVYFQGEWVTAEPRRATHKEIDDITGLALETWF